MLKNPHETMDRAYRDRIEFDRKEKEATVLRYISCNCHQSFAWTVAKPPCPVHDLHLLPWQSTGPYDPREATVPQNPLRTHRGGVQTAPQGWVCPICGRGVAPNMPECPCYPKKAATDERHEKQD